MAKIFHASLHGLSKAKNLALLASDIDKTEWSNIDLEASEYYLLIPQSYDLRIEYNRGWKVTDIFPVNGVGMTTARDHVVIDFEEAPILERAQIFRDSPESDREVCNQLSIPLKLGWNISRARQLIQAEDDLKQHIQPITYRPFDNRHIFYHDSLVWRTVKKIMFHMLGGDNLGLIIPKQTKEKWDVLATNQIIGHKSLAAYDINSLFPLYLYPTTPGEIEMGITRKPNITRLNLSPNSNKISAIHPHPKLSLTTSTPFSIALNTADRYAEFLKGDFPRVPTHL